MLLGAHTSGAGGLKNALLEGQAIGATTVQIFSANQRRWHSPSLTPLVLQEWHHARASTGIEVVMSHASYLLNLASPREEIRIKSEQGMREEIARCQALGIQFLNFHPGASVTASREEGLEHIIAALKRLAPAINQPGTPLLLFEATAGQGSCLGKTFEELSYLIEGVKEIIPIGVCLDTCHIFAAGYDLRTKPQLETLLDHFDHTVGLQFLKALHLNDSKGALGSRLDRHLPLGKGMIGIDAFIALMQSPRLKNLPKYLETPDGPPLWKEEIAMLRRFSQGNT